MTPRYCCCCGFMTTDYEPSDRLLGKVVCLDKARCIRRFQALVKLRLDEPTIVNLEEAP